MYILILDKETIHDNQEAQACAELVFTIEPTGIVECVKNRRGPTGRWTGGPIVEAMRTLQTVAPIALRLSSSLANEAARYRAERGVVEVWVYLWHGTATGWSRELEPANTFAPGVVAVAANGEGRLAIGGTPRTGAQQWAELA